MNALENLSHNGHIVLALCSGFALKESAGPGEDLAPLKLSAWNDLEKRLAAAGLEPAALAGKSAEDIARSLGLSSAEAGQIARLVDRGARLALDLERLFSAGMWVVTRVDEAYPGKLARTLKQHAPAVLFGAGEPQLFLRKAVAVVGSRNIDEAGVNFAKEFGRKAAQARLAVVSGGAKGTDRLAMQGALEADGIAIGAIADSLERIVRQPEERQLILDGRLVLVTPYLPTSGFSVGAAMGRNKLIYGLADYGMVVSSEYQTGGTWAGASEALKAKWCPVFVRTAEGVPQGNKELLKLGAEPFAEAESGTIADLRERLEAHAPRQPQQADLFS